MSWYGEVMMEDFERRHCQHEHVAGEDAGFERWGVRQVIGVCSGCGAAGAPADTTAEALEAFADRFPKGER